MNYETAKREGTELGHGIGDDGREYEGFLVYPTLYYFYSDTHELMEENL